MKAHSRKGQSRRARLHLSLEQLEARQLMAGDLASVAAQLDMTDAESQVSLTGSQVQTASAQRSASTRPGTSTNSTVAVAVRSIDGTGNNRANTELGSTNEQLLRVAAAAYADGISAMAGADRLSPRMISNLLVAQDEAAAANERGLSAFIYIWGQFLDHDIDLTESSTTNPERVPVDVPINDLQFDPDGTGVQVIPFTRSVYDPATGTSVDNPREQLNQITAWIDASMIYGSNQATADSLRAFVGGKLLTSAGGLPPEDEEGFIAGDIRANENIELTSMHALFIREHNRIAAKLARENPRWSDEQLYQQARAMVGAEVQVITYKEFLPALLGRGALDRYTGYDPTVDPSIANEFSTAAFRLHTLINDDVEFFGNDGRAVRDEIALREAFFNPDLLRETGIDSILKYAASTQAQEVDNQIVDGLRNFLFGQPGQGGLDLASLNIQRGRDHGLADYNSVREAYGLERVTSFAEITSNAEVQQSLEEAYGTVDNIDLWVGVLAEDHVAGSSVGELSQAIISDQFERLRNGDRFWYQKVFSGRTLAELEQTTLSSIIKRNTTSSNLQSNVFFMQAELTGQVFRDTNRNGRQDFREIALRGVTVELLDDEGSVIASTMTDRNGRYGFDQFGETGDYQVRIVTPANMTATKPTRDVLISRGGVTVNGINFALRAVTRATVIPTVRTQTPTTQTDRTTAVDTVFETSSESLLNALAELDRQQARSRNRR